MRAKQRKLQPKIERLFKALELKYSKGVFYSKYDIDKCGVLTDSVIIAFKQKYNVQISSGLGCLKITDNIANFFYLVGYTSVNGKRIIECRRG